MLLLLLIGQRVLRVHLLNFSHRVRRLPAAHPVNRVSLDCLLLLRCSLLLLRFSLLLQCVFQAVHLLNISHRVRRLPVALPVNRVSLGHLLLLRFSLLLQCVLQTVNRVSAGHLLLSHRLPLISQGVHVKAARVLNQRIQLRPLSLHHGCNCSCSFWHWMHRGGRIMITLRYVKWSGKTLGVPGSGLRGATRV